MQNLKFAFQIVKFGKNNFSTFENMRVLEKNMKVQKGFILIIRYILKRIVKNIFILKRIIKI